MIKKKFIFNLIALSFMTIYFTSCDETDSLIINPPNPFSYDYLTFLLDSETSETVRIDGFNSGKSPLLYTGLIDDSTRGYILLKINSDIINQYDYCTDTSIVSTNDIKLRVMTTEDLSNGLISFANEVVQDSINYEFDFGPNSNVDSEAESTNSLNPFPFLDAFFMYGTELTNFIELDTNNHNQDYFLSIFDVLNQASNGLEGVYNNRSLPIEFINNQQPYPGYDLTSIYLNLNNFITIDNLCSGNMQNFYVILAYDPQDQDIQYIELFSADFYNINLNPALFIDYNKSTQYVDFVNKYSINNISSDYLLSENFVYNSDSESEGFGTLLSFDVGDQNFSLNLPDSSYLNLNSDSLNNLITINDYTQSLFNVEIDLNQDYLDSISDINFYFEDVYFVKNDLDPSNDNWDVNDSSGTELNGEYDLGEFIFDYGFDNCPDIYEIGNSMCDSINGGIYNVDGTENNNQLDWEDGNDDGLWNDGEGEKWYDFGQDYVDDLYESGCMDDNNWISLDSTYTYYEILNLVGNGILDSLSTFRDTSYVVGEDTIATICGPTYWDEINCNICNYNDPHGDNYNLDPSNDDWNLTDSTGTELNGVYDFGEVFLDFGIDQIPDSLENFSNSNYDDNWDPITGIGTELNGVYDEGEFFFDTGPDGLYSNQELYYNNLGLQNNLLFDSNYEKFIDCGVDALCDIDEDDYDIDSNSDPENDNYIIDPNNDNDFENNGIWDHDDVGVDGCYENYELGSNNCLSDDAINSNLNNIFICANLSLIDSLILEWPELSVFDQTLCNNENYDFNNDNFSDENLNGTENNNVLDSNELFEEWLDYGPDQLIDSLETNYFSNYASHTLGTNLATLNISSFPSIGDSIILDSLFIGNNEVAFWISEIKRIEENKYQLEISLENSVNLKGLQFKLSHQKISEYFDTLYSDNLSLYPHRFNDVDNDLFPDSDEILENSDKFIQDCSMYDLNDYDSSNLMLHNGQGLELNLDFTGLNDFILNNQNAIIAYDQTKLTLYFDNDNENHNILDNVSLYFQIYDEDSEIFSNLDLINPVVVTDESESITIGIGPLIQKYLFSEALYLPSQNRGVRIKVSDYSNNFNSLIIEKTDSSKLPEIEIFYRHD